MIKDYFRLAIENISHRKIRSLLTIIGIVIGIAAVVALVSLGQGVKQVVTEEFTSLGADKIFVRSALGFTGGQGANKITDRDMETIKRVNGVNDAAAMTFKSGRVEYKNNLFIVTVMGLPLDSGYKLLEESYDIKYDQGRPLKQGDKYKVLVGHEIAAGKAFDRPVNVGDKLTIEGIDFTVVGTMAQRGDPDIDNGIIMPLDTLQAVFKVTDYSFIIVRTNQGEEPAAIADSIKKALRRERGEKEGEETFTVETIDQLVESFDIILNALSAIVIGIAAISLFVGGVGIMNTMYTAVLQRTNEIGVMKAIGARNRQILGLFLIESGLIGLIGGAIGIIIGITLSKIVEFIGRNFLNTILLRAYFPWYLILGALAFAFLVGTLSGLLPARQAAGMKPVDALRYE